MSSPSRKTVLITGCTPGGIGAALCLEFYTRGFHVYATFRDPSKAVDLEKLVNGISPATGKLEILTLDVTNLLSIQTAAATLSETTGLDILVNNAGAMLIGPLLDVDIEKSGHDLFEVNVWGMLRMSQAFGPLLVESKGAMLNISSIAGAVKLAWQGVYNASKAAETFFSETLRIEMEPLGVRVVTAMVGEVETGIYQSGGASSTAKYKLPETSLYKAVESFITAQAAGQLQTNNESAEKVAKSLVNDVLGGMSGQTWRGGVAGTARFALSYLPSRWFEKMLHSARGLDKVRPPPSSASRN